MVAAAADGRATLQAGGGVAGGGDEDDDARSAASTAATSTSLSSKLAALDFGGARSVLSGHSEASDTGSPGGGGSRRGSDDGSEPRWDLADGAAGGLLPRWDLPPMASAAAARLFRVRPAHPLRKLAASALEDLRSHGFVVMDGFVPRAAAAAVRQLALRLLGPGLASSSASAGAASTSAAAAAAATARPGRVGGGGPSGGGGLAAGELVLPLRLGAPPADSPALAAVLVALQELQEDLAEAMRLSTTASAEYSLVCSAPAPTGGGAARRPPSAESLGAGSSGSSGSGGGSVGGGGAAPRVTAILFCSDAAAGSGGALRLWPPLSQRRAGGLPPLPRSPSASDCGASACSTLSDGWAAPLPGPSTAAAPPHSASASCAADFGDSDSQGDTASLAGSDVARRGAGQEWAESGDGAMVLDVAPVAGRLCLLLPSLVRWQSQITAGGSGGGDVRLHTLLR